jgi:hypothetical protein
VGPTYGSEPSAGRFSTAPWDLRQAHYDRGAWCSGIPNVLAFLPSSRLALRGSHATRWGSPRSGLDRLAAESSLSRWWLASGHKPQIEPKRLGLGERNSSKVRVRRIQNVVPFPDNYRRNGQNC